jgi:DNA-binding response OmpR family regulator
MDRRTPNHRQFELAGARVLLVEDDRLILMELEAVVEDAGAKIVGTCTDVAGALAVVTRGEKIDAALLDVRLGRHSIAPVARALREHGVPFVFYSGQTETDPIHLEWPTVKIIHKPAPPWAIVSAIANLIDAPHTDSSRHHSDQHN